MSSPDQGSMLAQWYYKLLASLTILLVITPGFKPLTANAEQSITIQYSLRIYQDITGLYSNKPLLSGTVKTFFEKKSTGFQAVSLDLSIKKGGVFASVAKGSMERIVESPSLKHFAINPKLLQECRSKGDLRTSDGWELEYMGKSAISLTDNRMEEGYQVLLSFGGGSKEVLYDDGTGILLSEMFYIKTGFGQAYIVTLNVVSGPPFIGDEGIPPQNIFLLDVAALFIFFMSIIAIALRNRYRIL
jgi:hypothetical protein